jgi:hypothetical protein
VEWTTYWTRYQSFIQLKSGNDILVVDDRTPITEEIQDMALCHFFHLIAIHPLWNDIKRAASLRNWWLQQAPPVAGAPPPVPPTFFQDNIADNMVRDVVIGLSQFAVLSVARSGNLTTCFHQALYQHTSRSVINLATTTAFWPPPLDDGSARSVAYQVRIAGTT